MTNQSAMPEKRGHLKPHTRYRCLTRPLGTAGILLFFLIFSCSQKLPTSPVSPAPVSNQTAGPVTAGPAASLPVVGNLVGKLIGWLGGVLAIPVENTTRISLLVFPTGSLLQPISITASARFDSDENATFYDFGPDGLRFLKPVLLVHRAREPNGTVLNLWYFNPNTRQWEKTGSATVVAGTATFSILHFSKWAVSPEGDGLGSGGQQ